MARIVACTLPVAGHLFPFVPILDEMRSRGHDVTLALCSPREVPPVVHGFPVLRVSWSGPRDAVGRGMTRSFHRLSTPGEFAGYGEELAAGVDEMVARERPDFLLVDPMLWGPVLAAEGAGIPWATVAHNPLLFRGLGVDPRGPGVPPPTTWAARVRARLYEYLIGVETAEHLAEVNRVRAARALTGLERVTDLYTLPPLVLATTSEPFEYPRSDWPSGLRFVGPMICDPADSGQALPPLHDAIDPRPCILVAGSTIAADPAAAGWAATVLNALAGGRYRVITTLPTDRVDGHADVGAGEATLRSHSALLPSVSCVVCHGGAGIVHKALWFGVPVVAVPFALDRFEVARRVEVAGAGVMLPFARLTPDAVREAIRRALGRKEAAERVGKQLRQAGGSPAAADAIEHQLRRARPGASPNTPTRAPTAGAFASALEPA